MYWPYTIALYTAHAVPDAQRGCGFSLRPMVPAADA
jgi:hypothetical protein